MRILITGGSGFIGRNLAELLSPLYQVSAPSSAELDLLHEQAVSDYLAAHRFDVIVHTATTRSNRRVAAPADMLDRNCRMFFNLARNAGRFGKMLHFGSGAEYSRPGLPARVKEEYFDTRVPTDSYGFSKYICAKYIERCSDQRIVELRLFGVFGPYEDYTVRFISNACCRALKGLPIMLRQDVLFDYLYVKDLARITSWFIENEARQKAYNVCTGAPVALTELARMVAEVSGMNSEITVATPGMSAEYTADNRRLLAEMVEYQFWDLRQAIADLYEWYRRHESMIDVESLRFDEKAKAGTSI
jgi:GDP-L-fucose synthase